MSKPFFILGFLKQAELYGLANENNSATFEKYAELNYENCLQKVADLSGVVDSAVQALPFLAATNIAGAGLGSNYAPLSDRELKEELEYSEQPSLSKALKHLIPGYAGYRMAKENRLDNAYQNYLDTHNVK
jgi:hypothetical protein